MEELQRQLREARSGKALALHAQVMQVRMGPEASGEDELNAYLLRPPKAPKTKAPMLAEELPLAQAGESPRPPEMPGAASADAAAGLGKGKGAGVARKSTGARADTVKTAPQDRPASGRNGSPRGSSAAHQQQLASTLPAVGAAGVLDVGLHEQFRGTSRSAASSGGLRRQADDDGWDDGDAELVGRLRSVAACLIQQSWRRQRRRAAAPLAGSSLQGGSAAVAESCGARGASGACAALSEQPAKAAPLSSTAPIVMMMGTPAMGAGKGRSSTAHTMVGASATVAGLVPPSIRALHVALARSGLADAVDAFVWLDRAGKNGISQPVLAQGLKALCATNIDAGQVIFDLNPRAADGRVSAHEFVRALRDAQAGERARGSDAAAGEEALEPQVAAARARVAQIKAAVNQALYRSVTSSKPSAAPSASKPPATNAPPAPDPPSAAPDPSGAAKQGQEGQEERELKRASVLRRVRALLKRCGFLNAAEVIVFVESFAAPARALAGPTVQPPLAEKREPPPLLCEHVLAALKELRLTREVGGKELIHALGKRGAADAVSHRDLLQVLCCSLATHAPARTRDIRREPGIVDCVCERERVCVCE